MNYLTISWPLDPHSLFELIFWFTTSFTNFEHFICWPVYLPIIILLDSVQKCACVLLILKGGYHAKKFFNRCLEWLIEWWGNEIIHFKIFIPWFNYKISSGKCLQLLMCAARAITSDVTGWSRLTLQRWAKQNFVSTVQWISFHKG